MKKFNLIKRESPFSILLNGFFSQFYCPYCQYSDECHHAAPDTIVNVLNEVNAHCIYCVTATDLSF